MKITRNKIAKLPPEILTEIDRQYRDGRLQISIAAWLVAQHAESDVPLLGLKAGDSYSLVWTRNQKSTAPVECTCQRALSRWLLGSYDDWLRRRGIEPPRFADVSAAGLALTRFRGRGQPAFKRDG